MHFFAHTCPTHLILLDLVTWTACSSTCHFVQCHVTTTLLVTDILLSTLFLKTLNVYPLKVRDWLSYLLKTRGKITILGVIFFRFLYSKQQGKGFGNKWWKVFSEFNLLLILQLVQFLFISVVP
jgi:hypothetical protein